MSIWAGEGAVKAGFGGGGEIKGIAITWGVATGNLSRVKDCLEWNYRNKK